MNTEQNYVGKGDSTTSTEPTATPNPPVANTQAQTSDTTDYRIPANKLTFEPGLINIPVYLQVYGADQDNLGVSQMDVLLSALAAYKRKVRSFTDSQDKENTLITINELRDTILGLAYNRLSETSIILHDAKHGLPRGGVNNG